MNCIIKKGLTIFAIAAASSVFAAENEAEVAEAAPAEQEAAAYPGAPDPKSYGYTVLEVGLGSPIALPWGWDWDVFGLIVNLAYSDCNKMYGCEVAGGGSVSRLDMIGLQASIGCNFANRNAYGLQASIVNVCNRETFGLAADVVGINRQFYGLDVNVFGSLTERNFYGLNVSGIISAVGEDMWGMQAAVGCNFARRTHGLQIAALYNQTQDLRGAQVGLVNFANGCSAGFQVGLVNIILDNQIPFLPIVNAYF